MLTVHTKIEEEIFYPAAREAGLDVDMLDEALIEHASAKELIAQIQAGKPGDEFFDAKVKVLSDYVEHHVIEEHTEMFPKHEQNHLACRCRCHHLVHCRISGPALSVRAAMTSGVGLN